MDETGKRYALGTVYDSWVANNYISTGNTPMSRADWIEGALAPQNTVMPWENYRSNWEDFALQSSMQAVSGGVTKIKEGIDFGHRMFTKAYTKAFDNDLPPEGVPWPKTSDGLAAGVYNHIDNWFDRASSWASSGVGRANYVLGTHPSKSYLNSFAGGVGNFAGQLPFYMALGEGIVAGGGLALEGVGLGAEALAGTSGAVDAAVGRGLGTAVNLTTNITRALGATRTGSLIGKALVGYSEGYLSGTIAGKSSHERKMEGVDWAAQNVLFGLVGMNAQDLIRRYKLDDAARKWGAQVIRLGGKALGYTLFEGGISRAFNNHVNIEIRPDSFGWPTGAASKTDYHVDVGGQETHSEINRELGNEQEYQHYIMQGIDYRGDSDTQHGFDPLFTSSWDRSIHPIREHKANGITYQSRFVSFNRPILVRAVDSKGNQIAQVKMIPKGGGDVQTNWPFVVPSMRSRGIASALYKEIPAIAKSYGFTGFRSEYSRTNLGEGLWKGLSDRGFALPIGQGYMPGVPAYYRMSFNLFANEHGVPGTIPPSGIDGQFTWTPLSRQEIGEANLGRLEPMEGGRGISDAPHPDMPNVGHLVYNNKYYRYTNLTEMRTQYERLVRKAESDLRQYDPVRDSMTRASERVLYNLANQEFGRGDISRFTPEMLHRLYARYSQFLNEAAEEVPQHNPQDVRKEVTTQVSAQAQSSSQFASFAQRAQQELGVDVVEAVTEDRIRQNKDQTRPSIFRTIRDLTQAAFRRSTGDASPMVDGIDSAYTGFPSQIFTENSDYEPQEGASASYGGITPDVRRMMRSQRIANVETIKKARNNARRFLTDRDAREARLSSNRLASDATFVGQRDPRTYNQRLAAETTDDFVKTLEQSLLLNPNDHPVASGVVFEHPVSRFLFHWGDRKKLPRAVVEKLAKEIRKVSNDRSITYQQMDRASDTVAKELIGLAKINDIKSDGAMHIYGSNKYFAAQSIWQLDLVEKVNDFEKQLMGTILGNHPEALRDMEMVLNILQPKRTAAYDIEDWIKYNRAIDDAMRGVITPETAEHLRGIRTEQRAAAAAAAPPPTPRTRARTRAPRAPTSVTTSTGTTISRSPNFAENGEYNVTIGNNTRVMFRDPESGWWYENRAGVHFSQTVLGFNRQEAIAKLEQLYGTPAPTATPRTRTRRQPPPEPPQGVPQ